MNIQERRNKEGKITSYRIRVFDHRDVNGKQVFKTLSVKYDPDKSENWNRKNAEKQGIIFEKGVEEMTVSDSRITFDNYTDYFIELKKQAGIAPSTANFYRFNKKKLSPYIGHIQLKNLTPTALNKAYGELLNMGLSKRYVYALHVFIHNVLQTALKEGIIPRNYSEAATPPKAEKREVSAINEIDLQIFFELLYADEKHYMQQVFFSLLLATGCRIGELCALTWDNVDFVKGRVHICQHFQQDCTGYHIVKGCKTVSGERWLYMDEGIMDMLCEYRQFYNNTAKEYGDKWDYSANALFFTKGANPGGYINPNVMRMWFRVFLKKNGLPDYHPHQFRHTAISLQLQAGISVPDVAKRAGHSRPDVTLSIYAHTLKNNDKHCCEAVTKVIPNLPKAASN